MSDFGSVVARLASLTVKYGYATFSGLNSAETAIAVVVCAVVVLILAAIWLFLCCGICRFSSKTTPVRSRLQPHTTDHLQYHEMGLNQMAVAGTTNQVHPGASRLEHPRFQPTFLSDLAHSSSMEFQQSLISQQQQSSLHYPTHHPMGESLHPPPVGLGGVNPHRHVQLNEAQTFSVPMEPPRYSVMFPCEGGWKLERQGETDGVDITEFGQLRHWPQY